MGREIKRVEAGFNWPIGKTWDGFLMPRELHSMACYACDQSGYNSETQKISDSFYDSNNFGHNWTYEYNVDPNGNPATRPPWKILGHCTKWCNKITKDEVKALIKAKRLMDFTHTWTQGVGWKPREDNYIPTPEEVNKWSENGMGHDAINQGILVKARAKRLGVWGLCPQCKGKGSYYRDKAHQKAANNWEQTPVPTGEWWQVWETVSEGSPVTPAFATKDMLANYLMKHGDAWDQKRGHGGWTRESIAGFFESDWAPSGVMVDGVMLGAMDLDKIHA